MDAPVAVMDPVIVVQMIGVNLVPKRTAEVVDVPAVGVCMSDINQNRVLLLLAQPNKRILIKQYIFPGMDAYILDKKRDARLLCHGLGLAVLCARSFQHLCFYCRILWYPAVVVMEHDVPGLQLFSCADRLLKHLTCPLTDL